MGKTLGGNAGMTWVEQHRGLKHNLGLQPGGSLCLWDPLQRQENGCEEVTPLCEAVSANGGTLIHLYSKLFDKSCISSLCGTFCYPAVSGNLSEHGGSCRTETRAQHERKLNLSDPLKLLCDFLSLYRHICSSGSKAKITLQLWLKRLGFCP